MPETKIKKYLLKNVDEELKSQLMRLTIKKESKLRFIIHRNRILGDYANAKIYVLFENENPVGWLAAYHWSNKNERKYQIDLYIKRICRHKGYGSRLVKRAKKDLKKHKRQIVAMPFDEKGKRFYSKHNIGFDTPR